MALALQLQFVVVVSSAGGSFVFETDTAGNDSATSHELLQTPAPGGALSLNKPSCRGSL